MRIKEISNFSFESNPKANRSNLEPSLSQTFEGRQKFLSVAKPLETWDLEQQSRAVIAFHKLTKAEQQDEEKFNILFSRMEEQAQRSKGCYFTAAVTSNPASFKKKKKTTKAVTLIKKLSSLLGKEKPLYLSGQLIASKYKPSFSKALIQNLDKARRICNYIETEFFEIPNHFQRFESTSTMREEKRAEKKLALISLRNRIDATRKTQECDRITAINLEYKKNRETGTRIGNCAEICGITMKYAKDQEIADVEAFHILGGDHVFLVIGRAQNSFVNDYESWGIAAVICDPWSGSFYPASKLKTHLYSYISVETNGSICYARVSKFDPKKHSIELQHRAISNQLWSLGIESILNGPRFLSGSNSNSSESDEYDNSNRQIDWN